MTTKYFQKGGAYWQIVETQNIFGDDVLYAVEMDSTEASILGVEDYTNDWEFISDMKYVTIDDWFLRSNPADLFDDFPVEYEHEDTIVDIKLNEMLERIRANSKKYIGGFQITGNIQCVDLDAETQEIIFNMLRAKK